MRTYYCIDCNKKFNRLSDMAHISKKGPLTNMGICKECAAVTENTIRKIMFKEENKK